jgi:RNA polymerase sigma-70 factor, ECF subfamily
VVEIEDPGEGPEVSVQNMNRGDVLRKCLAALSRDHREIIDLVYYHEQPIEAVAEIVGIPASTVKTRMFYARRHLAELLSAAGLDRASL